MKKKVEKRLSLKKDTVTNLNHEEKKKIKGGTSVLYETCDCKTDHISCSVIVCCPPEEKKIAKG